MRYISTRNVSEDVSASNAIVRGLSRDGGLFIPETLPRVSQEFIENMCTLSYSDRAVAVMGLFLDDFPRDELERYCSVAYGPSGFDHPDVAPVRVLNEGLSFLELWHGPTSAFKDMALQILPYLLTSSMEKIGEKKQAYILVATSGDTGKAALEGFKDVEGTRILVFYPRDGVSDVQRLQMVTQEGGNVGVCAVQGNFDDAQTGVKAIFSDEELRQELAEGGYFLSSANSINWGRLLPQIVYYFSAYCDLLNKNEIKSGEKINFCVPTGNFGNILAGYLALQMGLPINRLICASNANNVLTDFFETGEYNRNRELLSTISPSMDILISSNLERLLFLVSGNDDKLVSGFMDSLTNTGHYSLTPDIKQTLEQTFSAGYCEDEMAMKAIAGVYSNYDYLIDTHTAVAFRVLEEYRDKCGDKTHCVIVSTASPYKFCDSVLTALDRESDGKDGLELIERLHSITGTPIPHRLTELKHKKIRHAMSEKKENMKSVVRNMLNYDDD